MFAAVREKLAGAWQRLREGSLIRLFLFEFVVVLLGVLAAQWGADWAEDNRLRTEAAKQFELSRETARNFAYLQRYWALHGQCIVDRSMAVARIAAEGGTMSSADIGRPSMPALRPGGWTDVMRQAGIDLYGADKMDAVTDIISQANYFADVNVNIRNEWATFALLDPANGPPSALDRANVRVAAIRVANHVRLLLYKSTESADDLQLLGIERPTDDEVRKRFGRIADECGMIRKWQ